MLVLALIGFRAPTAWTATLWSVICFVAMCSAYYGWAILVMGFPRGVELYAWLVLAVSVAPLLAAVAWWATRRRGPIAGGGVAGIAALILSGGAAWRVGLHFAGHLPLEATRPAQAMLELVMVAVVVLMLPRHGATRAWAVVMLVPAAWMMPRLLEAAGLLTLMPM